MNDEGSTQMVPEELSKESMTEEKQSNMLLALRKIMPDGIEYEYEFRATPAGDQVMEIYIGRPPGIDHDRKVGER